MADRRFLWLAGALTALSTGFHFETGYLAFLGVIVIALVAPGPLRGRLVTGAGLFVTSFVAAAWAVVPLFVTSRWAAVNELLSTTSYVRGYGAGQVVEWAFSGKLFDAKRSFPVISLAVLAGTALAVARWRGEALARALLALLLSSLLLSFGPTTWGPLLDAVPAHADLYFRRFMMGAQLAGTYLAGLGAVWVGNAAVGAATALWQRARHLRAVSPAPRRLAACATCAVGLAALWPAQAQAASYDRDDAAVISAQRSARATEGRVLAPLVDYVLHHGGGRTYAGLPDNWGYHFTVGLVPVYKYLEAQDVDQMSYIVPTSSLMLGPEYDFDEDNPGDYSLFGVRYLVLPARMTSPVPARKVLAASHYALWEIPSNGYVDLVEVTGTISADRADVASRSLALLRGPAPASHQDFSVNWPGQPAPAQAPRAAPGPRSPGVVNEVHADLARGRLSTVVTMRTAGRSWPRSPTTRAGKHW